MLTKREKLLKTIEDLRNNRGLNDYPDLKYVDYLEKIVEIEKELLKTCKGYIFLTIKDNDLGDIRSSLFNVDTTEIASFILYNMRKYTLFADGVKRAIKEFEKKGVENG